MHRRLLFVPVLFLAACAETSVREVAFEPPPPPSLDVLAIDRNRDGDIDRRELILRMTDVFNSLDKDRDGMLDVIESGRGPDWFRTCDRNFDGKTTISEFLDGADYVFDIADKNRKNRLTATEAALLPLEK